MHDALRRAVPGFDRSDSAGEEELGGASGTRACLRSFFNGCLWIPICTSPQFLQTRGDKYATMA
jgi:hypothetical protein